MGLLSKVIGSVTSTLSGGSNGGLIPDIAGFLGDSSDQKAAKRREDSINASNAALQREFAQNGIRWKVADARAAGISPLAALGATPYQAAPSYVGSDLRRDLTQNMGQDLSRAIGATRTQGERDDALYNLSLERAGLQNELLRSQLAASKIAVMNQAGGNPAFPGSVDINDERTRSRSGDPATTASGPKSAVTEFVNKDGSVSIWPSSDAKSAIEDSPYEYEHIWKNRVTPWLQDSWRNFKSNFARAGRNPINKKYY